MVGWVVVVMMHALSSSNFTGRDPRVLVAFGLLLFAFVASVFGFQPFHQPVGVVYRDPCMLSSSRSH